MVERPLSAPLGTAPSFIDALAQVSAAAPLDRPLLVIGERGAGKELVAERIHFLSRRWDQPLVKVNCAALSEELLESELFGHEAGAFTGATGRRAGRFERADGGTLFLDEIASASLRVQEKVLRVIEYGEYERLGSVETRTCDVRVVGATNLDLPSRVADGKFRADLLDRLAFDVVTLPPLRARRVDIPLLAAEFAKAFARELGRPFVGFTTEAEAALLDHPWPGNIRELKNVAERAVYRHFASGRGTERVAVVMLDPFESPWRPAAGAVERLATSAPLPAPSPSLSGPATPAEEGLVATVAAYEKRLVEDALAASGLNQRRAATALGLSYDQLRGLVKKHGIRTSRRSNPTTPPRA